MAQLCTYARIDTVEIPFSGDLMDSWEDPTSFFLMDGVPYYPSCSHLQMQVHFLLSPWPARSRSICYHPVASLNEELCCSVKLKVTLVPT